MREGRGGEGRERERERERRTRETTYKHHIEKKFAHSWKNRPHNWYLGSFESTGKLRTVCCTSFVRLRTKVGKLQ